MNMTDGQLLQLYWLNRSESSFEELVRRHIGLVYSAALRQVNDNSQDAEDVTQAVFTDLARKAAKLSGHSSLAGWLYTSTRFLAANARRANVRRQLREQEVHSMNAIIQQPGSEPEWARIRPLLDEAIHILDAPDREAVLLRHFECRTYAEIGSQLGLTENAARMRVDRALEKLQQVLAKHGVTSTAMALAALLATNAATAAPAQLAATVASTAITAASATGFAFVLEKVVATSRIKIAGSAVVVAGVVALLVVSRHTPGNNGREVAVTTRAAIATNPTNANDAEPQMNDLLRGAAPALSENDSLLHLQIVAADSGLPVPLVEVLVSYSDAWGDKKFVANRFGVCDVMYSKRQARRLQVWTQSEGFADTQLLWRTDLGEVIPTNFMVRLDRATPIGGRVVDPDGNPVGGATVELHLHDDPGGVVKVPDSHEFPWAQVTTGKDGRWRTERVGEDVLGRLEGFAKRTNYLDSTYIFASFDRRTEQQLRAGTLVFKLGRAASVVGTVVDEAGAPVSRAKLTVGRRFWAGTREGETDDIGSFSFPDCEPGWQWVTAERYGYAATTMAVQVSTESKPIRVVLGSGKVLRLRVLDHAGDPISGAKVYLEHSSEPATNSDQVSVQAMFQVNSDADGRVAWTNAPEGELLFGFEAPGNVELENVRIPADGEEHSVTLASALVIQGAVSDATTGRLLPRFRIGLGYPSVSDRTTNITWARFDRFWVEFTNGTYRYHCDEPLVRGIENPGWAVKFEAAGYASLVSRIIAPDEGVVQLDAALRPAANTTVTVFNTNGQLAPNVDVGSVFPGSPFQLIRGGLSPEASPGGSHMTTDKNGTFELRPDDSVQTVLFVSTDGYFETTPAALVANPMGTITAVGPIGSERYCQRTTRWRFILF